MGKKKQPGLPDRIMIAGRPYVLQLFRIRSKDGHNRPMVCDRIPDEATINVGSDINKEFMTAYIPLCMVRP